MSTKPKSQIDHPHHWNPGPRLLSDSFDDAFANRTQQTLSRDGEHSGRDGEHHLRDGEHTVGFVSPDAAPDPSSDAGRVRSVNHVDLGLATDFRAVVQAAEEGQARVEERHGGGAVAPVSPPKARPRWSETAVAIWELERFPWHSLGQNGRDQAIAAAISPNGRLWRAFLVERAAGDHIAAEESRDQSGHFDDNSTAASRADADVLLAMMSLAKSDSGEAKSWCRSQVTLALRQIVGAMHPGASAAERRMKIGGGNTASVIEALSRLNRLRIVLHKVTVPGIPACVPLRLFKSFKLAEQAGVVSVEFDDWVHTSLAEHPRLISLPEYFSIKLPTARRLYRYLECRRWAGDNERSQFELSLSDLVRDLPILQTRRAHVVATLDAAHDELRQIHYLLEAPYGSETRRLSRSGSVEGRGLYRLRAWRPWKARGIDPITAEMHESLVDDWLDVLNERGNRITRAFARKACAELGPITVRKLISAARSARTRGKSLEEVRTAITARAVGLMGGSPEDWK